MVTYQINNVCMHGVSYMCSSKNDTHGVFILSVTVKQSTDKASDQSQINVISSLLFLSFFSPMYLSISHSSRYGWWNKASVIFRQLYPAAQHTTSRPPEGWNSFSVLWLFPLGLLPVGLNLFYGDAWAASLPGSTGSVLRSSSTHRSSWNSKCLAFLHRLCQQPAEKNH